MSDAGCDDGLYCNGIEQCDNGNCIPGAVPCQASQVCNESRDQCRDVKTKPGRIEPAVVSRPLYQDEKTKWIMISTNEDNYFNKEKSHIVFTRSGSNSEGMSVDSVKRAFKIKMLKGTFIFLPVRLHKQAMTGDWDVIINTEVDGQVPFEENIVSTIKIK
jgi:hypothetical protein